MRVELMTFAFGGQHSIHLSYEHKIKWRSQKDLNLRPNA